MGLLAPLLCLAPFLAHIYCEDVFGIVGENFTFPVKVDQKVVETTWKKNKDKVAEWERLKKPTYFGPLCNRSVLMEDGSLTIVDLKKDDAGTYELQYWDSSNDHYLNFILVVLDPLPEPKISCNTSDHELVLNCTANFQGPLNYTWKLSNNPQSYQKQELSIPLEDVNPAMEATCLIKFSQMERSCEISLNQCLPAENGGSYKRNRAALFGVFVVVAVGSLAFLFWKGIIPFGRGRKTAQNSPANGSGEHEQLFHGDSQQHPTSQGAVVLARGSETTEVETMDESEGGKKRRRGRKKPNKSRKTPYFAAFSQAVHCENEEPEADREFNEEDSAPKDKQIVKNGVNQEDTFRNSSVLANHADEPGINEGEVTQDAEGGNGEHLNNSPS